jgi:branched-chain amino acid transport system substrate-binding protein
MHTSRIIVIQLRVAAFLLASLLTTFTPQAIAARLALVVGNDTYSKIGHLVNARNDARAMSRELKAAGFDVTQSLDVSYREMVSTLGAFVQQVKAGDEVVFFFSGHGVQIKSGSYLLPVDIRGDSETVVERTALALDDAMDQIKQANPRFTLVLVDACRSNPFKTTGRNIGEGRGLKPPEPPKGQMVVFSAGRGQAALDRLSVKDTNPNGLFTREFIARMRGKGVAIEQLMREVQDSVERQAASVSHEQRPALYNESRGNFYFYAPTTIIVQPNPAPSPILPAVRVQSADEIEQQAWDAAQSANHLTAFKAFLEEYPSGRFAGAARVKIAGQQPAAANTSLLIKIGHVAPTTGVIAHLGHDNENGARLAIQELNARNLVIGGQKTKFELVTQDDAASPSKAISTAEYFVANGVSGVVGHLNSGTSIPASAIYHQHGLPHISPSSTNPKLTEQGFNTTFRMLAHDKHMSEKLGIYSINTLNAKRIAVITDKTAYGNGIAEAFTKSVILQNGTIVATESTTDKATDFTNILIKIKAQNPDLIFFGGMDSVAGPMLRQIKALGILAKFMGGDGICSEGLVKLADGGMDDGQVVCAEAGGVTNAFRSDISNFKAKFRAIFNAEVQVYAPYTYDAVMIFASAIIASGSHDPRRYLPFLRNINYKGITGEIRFDSKGDIINGPLTLYTYKNGRRSEISVIR